MYLIVLLSFNGYWTIGAVLTPILNQCHFIEYFLDSSIFLPLNIFYLLSSTPPSMTSKDVWRKERICFLFSSVFPGLMKTFCPLFLIGRKQFTEWSNHQSEITSSRFCMLETVIPTKSLKYCITKNYCTFQKLFWCFKMISLYSTEFSVVVTPELFRSCCLGLRN